MLYTISFETQIDGNHSKNVVFEVIDSILSQVQKDKETKIKLGKSFQNLKHIV